MAGFVRIEARVSPGPAAERVAAEAYAAGAVGLEERDEGGTVCLLLYAPAGASRRVVRAVRAAGVGARVSPARPVPQEDWAERWKTGLRATVVSPRLIVRPSFVPARPTPGRAELVLDPGQAFGTGAHASTRLALEWIDALAEALPAGARALDVGTGSGVLALAIARLTDAHVVAVDLDPLATSAARENASRNGLAPRVQVCLGSVDALRPGGFDLVVANLLRRELLPIAPELVRAARPGGQVVLSGLLAADGDAVVAALGRAGLALRGSRERQEAGDRWLGLLMAR